MKEENLDLTTYDPTTNGGRGERGSLRMFLKDVERIQMLTKEDEMTIARRSRMGDEASRNRLIESNLRFVIKVVYQYWSPGLPMMDMISEGCQGLIRATKTFDPDKGFRFLTYANNSIAQCVINAIKDYQRYKYDSLNETVYEDGSEVTREELLESEDPQSDATVFLDQVRDMLNRLSDRERMIITLRFWDGLTYDDIGLRICVSRERVRQIETRALRKLRWAIDAKGQREYLEIQGLSGRK